MDQAEQSCQQVAADEPSDHEVERAQAAAVAGLERHEVAYPKAAVRCRLGLLEDPFDRAGLRGATGRGDEQHVTGAGQAREKDRGRAVLAELGDRSRLSAKSTRGERLAGQGVEVG